MKYMKSPLTELECGTLRCHQTNQTWPAGTFPELDQGLHGNIIELNRGMSSKTAHLMMIATFATVVETAFSVVSFFSGDASWLVCAMAKPEYKLGTLNHPREIYRGNHQFPLKPRVIWEV